ncbi:MAG TPA: polysaccharide deacetylase family protein [Ktedonosporobacter sp.]|jgi:peptidoglycan/xylan/chitin deacetylase (PgdA/CDA1 family)|nr:polysaccharide deacetylase family protein [Ktedonosporobacter sp.]
MKLDKQEPDSQQVSQAIHIPVLTYHSISLTAQDYNSVSAAAFAEQMAWIARYRRPLTLAEAQTALKTHRVPKDAVLITFDDGYREVLEHAVPLLLKYAIPAVFFLLIEALGSDDRWNPRAEVIREHFTPEEVYQLAHVPGITIGAHGFTHQRITRFEEYRMVAEMVGAKAGLEALTGKPVVAYAYPYGGFTVEAARIASRYFELAFASEDCGTWNWQENPYTIRRLHIARQLSLDGFIRLVEKGKASPSHLARRSLHT